MNYPQQMKSILGKVSSFFLDTIFPIKCIGCGLFPANNKKEYLCKSCLATIPVKKTFECIGCSRSSRLGKTCLDCQEYRNIDHLLAVSDYSNPIVKKAIKILKYRFVGDMAGSFRPLIRKYIYTVAKRGLSLTECTPVVIPIPLHPRRLNWRGFNHAEILANLVSESILTETATNILVRSSYTKPQADIENRKERIENIGNIFGIDDPAVVKNRTIVLVDDICTTGTTLNQAAKALKANGALKVICLVIARS